MTKEKIYSVSQLSKLAGVTVRTLHHYDNIGLLKPSRRADNGYREYNYRQLVKLQQILIYKALDFGTDSIKELLGQKDDELLTTLDDQKSLLVERIEQLNTMIGGIDLSMKNLKSKKNLESIFESIPKSKLEEWHEVAKKREGDKKYEQHIQRFANLTENQVLEIKKRSQSINIEILGTLNKDISSTEVQEVVEKFWKFMEFSQSILDQKEQKLNLDKFTKLAQELVDVPERREAFDIYAEGLAEHFSRAMFHYVQLKAIE